MYGKGILLYFWHLNCPGHKENDDMWCIMCVTEMKTELSDVAHVICNMRLKYRSVCYEESTPAVNPR